jgi:hypothetical protein
MAKLELMLNYEGAITNPENIKKDFRKAMRIILLSILSSAALSTGLFFLLNFLKSLS